MIIVNFVQFVIITLLWIMNTVLQFFVHFANVYIVEILIAAFIITIFGVIFNLRLQKRVSLNNLNN